MTAIKYNPDSGLASFQKKGIEVATILSRPGRSFPTAAAFLLASYSRRKESLFPFIEESSILSEDDTEGLEGARRIIDGYGHGSVRGLGHFLVMMEGVSVLNAMRIFNYLPLQDGQELSTRYVNMEKNMVGNCVPLPPYYSDELREGYQNILQHWADSYRRLLPLTEAALREHYEIPEGEHKKVVESRTLDVARYLIPLGYRTRMGLIQSGREWSRLISFLLSSGWDGEDENNESILLGRSLLTLLTERSGDYVPEAETLIRHYERVESITEHLLSELEQPYTRDFWPEHGEGRTIEGSMSVIDHDGPAFRYHLLRKPLTREYQPPLRGDFYTSLWREFNHMREAPIQCRGGQYSIHGMTDIGSLKDMNRHRDMFYIPFLDEHYRMREDIFREIPYSLCPYLYLLPPDMGLLRKEYIAAFDKGYEMIRAWSNLAYGGRLLKRERREIDLYTKYLCPHGHETAYIGSGSPSRWNYLCTQRTRPGGHIAYRQLAREFAIHLENKSLVFSGLVENCPLISVSKEEFLNRS